MTQKCMKPSDGFPVSNNHQRQVYVHTGHSEGNNLERAMPVVRP